MGDSYVASLRQKKPTESVDLLRARWDDGTTSCDRLAQWIHDYSKLQMRQSAELESFLAKHVLDESALGTFAEPWQRTASMVLEQARLATEAAKRADAEGNSAIRGLSKRPEIDRLLPLVAQGNENAVEEFQKFDQLRLDGLKSSLTSFASIEVDRAQGMTRAAENAMQAWLNYDSTDGIQAFVAQIISGVAPTKPSQSRGGSGSSRGASAATAHQPGSQAASRQSSQATVQRKSSFLGRKDKDEPKSPGGLRSRVGSIFGRKKNKAKTPANSNMMPLASHSETESINEPRQGTRPPDFGPRQPSQLSMRSNLSSQAASLRQNRQREYEDSLYAPSSPTKDGNEGAGLMSGPQGIAPLTPTKLPPKSTLPRAPSPLRSSSTVRTQGGAPPGGSVQGSTPINNHETNARGSNQGPLAGPAPPSSNGFPGAVQSTAPTSNPNAQPSSAQPGPASLDQDPQPPMPPPARHSLHRVSSLSRTPSSASARARQGPQNHREPVSYRDSRVGSQVFTNLTPAEHDTSRDSILPPGAFGHQGLIQGGAPPSSLPVTSSPGEYGSNVTSSNGAGPALTSPSGAPPQLAAPTRETEDSLGPLPVPATPYSGGGANSENSGLSSHNMVGMATPEQFWTPAQKFAPQFANFEQANTSVASVSSLGRQGHNPPVYPPLPEVSGLVAAAIEHIEAEYDGENLVSSSVRGEAVARINGVKTADSVVLGILLADPNAKLTPSNLLKQTSSLSFDVPFSIYAAEANGQELVQYSADSATGRIPIKLTPIWRFESNTVRLVLSYQLSELYVGGDEVEIEDLVITVSIAGAARAHAAQSKPVATFSREKQRVTWRFTQPQTLYRGQTASKLLCQFVTDGGKAMPGKVELKTRLPSVKNSVLQLRTLSPQGDWVAVPTAVSGDVSTRLEKK